MLYNAFMSCLILKYYQNSMKEKYNCKNNKIIKMLKEKFKK
jgi:hypothetical protein